MVPESWEHPNEGEGWGCGVQACERACVRACGYEGLAYSWAGGTGDTGDRRDATLSRLIARGSAVACRVVCCSAT